MHLRVKMDVRKSLMREKEVKKPSSSIMVTFKYKKLPVFCFLCGRIGHIDRACAVRFHFTQNVDLPLLWDVVASTTTTHSEGDTKSMTHSPSRGTKGGYTTPWRGRSLRTGKGYPPLTCKYSSDGHQFSNRNPKGHNISIAWSGY
ncbi:hypothetical protein LINGRAHAP2_LOCUS4613 [Linum grandiflorum]